MATSALNAAHQRGRMRVRQAAMATTKNTSCR
jgi:hypothetical protein